MPQSHSLFSTMARPGLKLLPAVFLAFCLDLPLSALHPATMIVIGNTCSSNQLGLGWAGNRAID